MASGTINGRVSYNSSYQSFGLSWSSTPNTSTNTSTLNASIWFSTSNTSKKWDTVATRSMHIYIYVNGQEYSMNKVEKRIDCDPYPSNPYTIYSASCTINHNSNGTPPTVEIQAYANGTASSGGTNYGPGKSYVDKTAITLDTIPRYANFTSFNVNKRDETSLNVTWGANANCDYAWYRIRQSGGSYGNWIGGVGTNFNITGLSANTTYVVQVRIRRQDSQLTTDSGDGRQTTYDYPSISSTPNFIIGDPLTIGIYNPLGRTVAVYLKDPLGNETTAKETSGTSVGDYTEETYKDFLYNGIPNSPDGQYSVRLVCPMFSRDTTVLGGTYTVRGDETPTFTDFTYNDINPTTVALSGSTAANPIIINGYSTVQATVSVANKATGNKYANMDKYVLSDGSNSAEALYSDDSTVNISLTNFSGSEISLAAVDKRKLSTIVVKAGNIKNYTIPVINNLTVSRNDGGIGQVCYMSFNGTWWNDTFGSVSNSITDVSYYYKETTQDEEQWVKGDTVITPTTNDNYFSASDIQIDGPLENGGFKQDTAYNIKIVVTDKLDESTSFEEVLINAQPGIAIYNNCVSICTSYDPILGGILQVNHGIVRDGHLLYNNISGDNGDITLNDTVDDYLYLEVYYKSNDGYYGSQKIYEPNNKTISLITGYRWEDFYLKYKTISIVDDTISTDQYVQVVLPHHGQIELWGDNYIYIVQVIGYK